MPESEFSEDLIEWSLNLVKKYPEKIIWVENVTLQGKKGNDWGTIFNAAQFGEKPIQNRNRIIGGNYPKPNIKRDYQKVFKNICPCITATEYKGCASDKRRASRFYGRRLTIEEVSFIIHLSVLIIKDLKYQKNGMKYQKNFQKQNGMKNYTEL